MRNIGFGCVRLTSSLTEKQAIGKLEFAFDQGISHFDVARLYGYGLAEGILSKFARDKRDKITITTKFGLFPNTAIFQNLLLQNLARRLFNIAKNLPFGTATKNLAGRTVARGLTVKDLQASLETSLRELNTDYVDFLLLHEATIAEANNESLIEYLEAQKDKGTILGYGVGSFAEMIIDDVVDLPESFTVLQTDNSFPYPTPDFVLQRQGLLNRFYFSPFRHLGRVSQLFNDDPTFLRHISEKLGFDARESVLDLFLMQQAEFDSEGTFLFTSSKNNKIKQVIERWRYIQSFPAQRFEVFQEVRHLIKIRLDEATK